MDYNIALFFVGSAFVMLAVRSHMRVYFYKTRTPFPVTAISYCVYPIAMTIVYIFYGLLPIAGALIAFSSIFIISLNYEAPKRKRLGAVASIVAIGLILYYTISIAFGIYLHSVFTPLAASRSTVFIFFVEVVLFPVLFFASALFIKRFKSIKKNVIALPVFWFSALAIPLSSTIVVFIVAFSAGLSIFAKIAILCILVATNLLVLYLHDTLCAAYEARLLTTLHDQEKKYYFTQCRLMQESVEQVKSIRHDIKMHLATIKGYAVTYKADKITEYLDALLGGIGEARLYSETGNIAFDSIINYKLGNTRQQNIKLDINLEVPPALNVELSDISVILGNLLDNALDAVAKVQEKQIKLNIQYNRETLFIMVENTFDGVVNYAQDKGEKRIVTRKDGSEHGHGLRNIRGSIDKYNGCMDITHEGALFSVALMLYVDGQRVSDAC